MRTITYAIGDVHGRLDLLDDLLHQIETHASVRDAAAKIVFTGDYVDRGYDSCGVVERLMAGPRRPQDRFVPLRGNHDDLLVRAATTGDGVPDWAWFLFNHTLESYGRRAGTGDRLALLRRHVDYLSSLPLTHDDGHYLFVHAGIRPGVPLADQDEADLIWIRDEFLFFEGRLPRRVVHGHTIMGELPVTTVNRVSIDTGAFRTGRLTAAVLDEGAEDFLQAIGKPDAGAIEREHRLMLGAGRGVFDPPLDRRPPLRSNDAID
jgi:serine/threonine protein phosphatase 1